MKKDVINNIPVYFHLLTEEGKDKMAKDILIEAIKSTSKSVIMHPETHEIIDLKKLTKDIGFNETATIIKEILRKASENPENNTVKAYNNDDLKQLFAQLERDEIKDREEAKVVELLKKSVEKELADKEATDGDAVENSEDTAISGSEKFINSLSQLIETAQKEWGYSPKLIDLLYSSFILSTISLVHTKGSEMNTFRSLEPSAVFEIYNRVGHDILEAWQEQESAPIGTEMMVMGLLSLAVELSIDIEHDLISGDKLKKIFNPDGCDCDCSNCSCI